MREANEDAETDGIAKGGEDVGQMALGVTHGAEYIRS